MEEVPKLLLFASYRDAVGGVSIWKQILKIIQFCLATLKFGKFVWILLAWIGFFRGCREAFYRMDYLTRLGCRLFFCAIFVVETKSFGAWYSLGLVFVMFGDRGLK